MKIILHEIRQLLSLRPVCVALCVMLPLLIFTAFVPKVQKPIEPSNDVTAAETRYFALGGIFDDLAASLDAEEPYTEILLKDWVAFAGQTDDIAGDITGAYYYFYEGDPLFEFDGYYGDFYGWQIGMWSRYARAQQFFRDFYDGAYTNYLLPYPRIFIKQSAYDVFTGGIERLNALFTAEYTNLTELREGRRQMTDIRIKTPFRRILVEAKTMTLTQEQVGILNEKLETYEERRKYIFDNIGIFSTAEYVSFLDMVYRVVTWDMERFIESNADFDTRDYYGFTTLDKEYRHIDVARTKYCLEKDLFSIEYSVYPSGMRFRNMFTTMHAESGTTAIDRIFNAAEIALPFLIIFMIVISFYVVFMDVRAGTIIGAIASPHSRITIIFGKTVAALIAMSMIFWVFAFGALFIGVVFGGISGALPPTVLMVLMGDLVVPMKPVTALFIYYLGVMVKMLLVFAVTAIVSLILLRFRPRFEILILFIATVTPFVLFLVADYFLRPFVAYGVFLYPIMCVTAYTILHWVFYVFNKKEYI